ncbi:hypothetical protein Taro_036494 [Colocasia esculenta]|uniref:Serine aminopeptidase S33 domain-containing protein n=1 Tax=Colocasia esculenta TaxID=4460 RepID=A0A843WDI2_COLES|nr:hypothetical protein [Colocasia esculenta]
MAASASSLSSAASLLPLCSSSASSSKRRLSFSFHPLQSPRPFASLSIGQPSSRVFAAPEVLESTGTIEPSEETLGAPVVGGLEDAGTSPLSLGDDADADEALATNQSISSSKLFHALQKDRPLVSEQRVLIKNNYGETLVGILHETDSKELVILCHGFRSSKESKTLLNLADALTKEGITVFRFDFSGNGESEGSFEYGNYWKEVDDLRAVILYFLEQRREVSGIMGHSKGGNIVLLYASIYQDILTVINISGRFALGRGIEERLREDFIERIRRDGFIDVKDQTGKPLYRVTEKSLMDRLAIDMHYSCLLIDNNCRVLTVHGSADETVPVEDATEFANFIPNHKLHIIEGADHRYTWHRAELTSTILDFINK